MSIEEQLPQSDGLTKLPPPLPDIFDNLEAVTRHTPDFGRHSGVQDDLLTRIGEHSMRLLDLCDQLARYTHPDTPDSHRVTPDILDASKLAHTHTKQLDDPQRAENAATARIAANEARQALLRGDRAVLSMHEQALLAGALIRGSFQDALSAMNEHHQTAAENTQKARARTRTTWEAVFSYHYDDSPVSEK